MVLSRMLVLSSKCTCRCFAGWLFSANLVGITELDSRSRAIRYLSKWNKYVPVDIYDYFLLCNNTFNGLTYQYFFFSIVQLLHIT